MFNLLLHGGTVAEQAIHINLFIFVAAAYGYGLYQVRIKQPNHPWQQRHALAFYAGLVVMASAMLTPIDTFNDELFWVHMLQHLLMMLVAAPLILLGRPVQLALRAMPGRWSKEIGQRVFKPKAMRSGIAALSMPLIIAFVYNANFVFWHVPYLYEATLSSSLIHYLMHATYIGTAFLFWWPIIDPVPRHHKYSTGMILVQLAVAMLCGKILGAVFTFAPNPIYDAYVNADRVWGMSPMVDQQISGIVMLVGGFLVYAVSFMVLLAHALLRADKRAAHSQHRRKTLTIRQVDVEPGRISGGGK